MLKIKDNVDLKELEKYGLKPYYKMKDNEKGEVYIDFYYSSKHEPRWGYIRLKPVRKILCLWFPTKIFENNLKASRLIIKDEDYLDMDLLYDLIKDGLVEKVGE